jgi:hypothetical protein
MREFVCAASISGLITAIDITKTIVRTLIVAGRANPPPAPLIAQGDLVSC